MYQHSVLRPSTKSPKPLSLRLLKMPFNEKAAFVEHVCAILGESRFGPGRVSQLIVKLSDEPELEPAVFYDNSDGELVPCYALSPVGRNGYQVVEAAYRRAKQMGLVAARPNEISASVLSPNQGRGSP